MTKAKVNADVAGLGIAQNADGSLEVGVDGTTIEITGDVINLVDGSVTTAKLAADAVTNAQLSDNAVQTENILDGTIITADLAATSVTKTKINADVAGLGLDKNLDGSLEVEVDGVTIEITGDAINLKDASVTTAKLAADAVTNAKLADNAVQTENVLDGTLLTADIAALQITTGLLAADAVTNTKLADNAVQTENILDGAVGTADLAATSVTKAKVNADVAGLGIAQNADGSLEVGVDGTTIEITGDVINLVDGSVTTAKLAADAVTNAQLSDNAVQTENILDGTIITADLAATSVTKAKINADVAGLGLDKNLDGSLEVEVDGVTIEITGDAINLKDASVTTAKLAADAVTNAKLADNAVQTENVLDGTLLTADIAALQITTGLLAADAVTNTKLADNAVQTENILDGAVGTADLAATSVTKAKVNADVAGLGIAQNADGSLEVGVDGTTIEITGDVINLVDGSVTTAKLAADAVTNAQLSDNAVQTENILDGTIITADLAATSVTKAKINADVAGLGLDKNLDGSLEVEVDGVTIEITGDAINLKDASVTTAKLAADAVTNAKLADNAVQTENVLDGTLLTADIAALQITTGLLAADAVTNTKLADNAVQTRKHPRRSSRDSRSCSNFSD